MSTDTPSTSTPTWDPAIITGAVFAIMAVVLGIPGAILAIKKLRTSRSATQGTMTIPPLEAFGLKKRWANALD